MRRVKVSGKKKELTGNVIYENEYFITIQGPHYRECFLKVDIENDFYQMEEMEGAKV